MRFDGILLGLLLGTWNSLGDKLQQQVAATDHSVCAGPTTSCSHMLGRHVAATNPFVYTGESFVKILSQSATLISSSQQVAQILYDLIFATCRCDKVQLQRRRFSQKFSNTQGAICRCEVCCCNFSPSVYQP